VKVLISFSRNRWEAYVGLPQKEVFEKLVEELERESELYKVAKAPPNFMYDAENEQIIIDANGLVISIIYVSADPLTRLFSSIIGTKGHLKGITLLSIQYHSQSKSLLKSILTNFAAHCPQEPWKIRGHPRFQFAILLEIINKLKWRTFTLNKI
jgi:hypothetical protein